MRFGPELLIQPKKKKFGISFLIYSYWDRISKLVYHDG